MCAKMRMLALFVDELMGCSERIVCVLWVAEQSLQFCKYDYLMQTIWLVGI